MVRQSSQAKATAAQGEPFDATRGKHVIRFWFIIISMLKLKRVYEKPEKGDGKRILIDGLWPRGLTKEKAEIDIWMKEVAPSPALRKWFSHDPKKWMEFKKRYREELKDKKESLSRIKSLAKKGTVTILYGSKEERFNNANALKGFLRL